MRVVCVCVLCLAACLTASDDFDVDPARLRETTARELAERIELEGGYRVEGSLQPGDEGPQLVAVRVPLEVADDVPFQVTLERATGDPTELSFEIESSGLVQHAPLREGVTRGVARPAARARMQRRYIAHVALRDAEGRSGRSIQVPFHVFATPERIDGLEARIFTGHSGPVEAVHQLDASRLATGGADGLVRIWDAGVPVASFTAHDSFVYDVHLRDDEVISIGESGLVRAHDHEGRVLWERQAHATDAGRAMDADDEHVFTGGRDGLVVASDLDTGAEQWTLDVGDRVNDLAVDSIGRVVVGLGRFALPGAVLIVQDGEVVERPELPEDVTAVSWLGESVAIGFGRGMVRTYDPSLDTFVDLETEATDTIEDVQVARGLVMAVSLSGLITVWSDGTLVMQERFAEETFGFHANDTVAAFGTAQGTTWLFDLDVVMP